MTDYSKLSVKSYTELFLVRQPVKLTEKLLNKCVGIAGTGGLGTVVAENLARAGVGKLVIADFDMVDPSNLNRQRFTLNQVGMMKVNALADNIRAFNPHVDIEKVPNKIDALNCEKIFSGCDVIAECLDSAAEKAMFVSAVKNRFPATPVVAVSGIAGTQNGSDIAVHKLSDTLYLVGDQQSDADSGMGLFATRVGIAASQQSHLILQLLLGVAP